MPETSAPISVFQSSEGQARFMAAYNAVLERWPVPYEELDIPTRFGVTHIIASGPREAPPLFLIHCFCGTATVWYPNQTGLCQHFRTYAVDVIGEANKSQPVRRITSRAEMAQWMVDVFDALQVQKAYLAGNSFGGFITMNQAMHTPERLSGIVMISPAAVFHQIFPFYTHMFLQVMFGWEKGIQKGLDWAANGVPLDDCWTKLFTLSLRVGRPASIVLPKVFKAKELQQVRVPATLMIGDHEVIYPPESTLRQASRMMPGLKTVLLPHANHIAAMANVEEVNKRIVEAFGS